MTTDINNADSATINSAAPSDLQAIVSAGGRQLIEASAGTGKTYTIANLYIMLLLGRGLDEPLPVDRILVLTFTIAATQELRQRITGKIREVWHAYMEPSDDLFISKVIESGRAAGNEERERQLLAAALQLMDEAAIFTIHGFCQRVLKEQPFDAGTLFDQALSTEQDQLRAYAAQDLFRSQIMDRPKSTKAVGRIYNGGAGIQVATEQNHSPGNTSSGGLDVGPDIQLAAGQSQFPDKGDGGELESEAMAGASNTASNNPNNNGGLGNQALPAILHEMAREQWPTPDKLLASLSSLLTKARVQLTPAETATGLDLQGLEDKIRQVKDEWRNGDIEQKLKDANLAGNRKPARRLHIMRDFCMTDRLGALDELWQIYSSEGLEQGSKKDTKIPNHPVLDLINEIHNAQPQVKQEMVNLWHSLHRQMLQRLEDLKAGRHMMTMDDLLTRVEAAVTRQDSSLPSSLARRWPVIMVDEFQDTDEIQNSIFQAVFQEGGLHSLLMIGDPKQAIFQFRGADIYTYLNARQLASETYKLGTNFRSSPAMVKAVNHLIGSGQAQGQFDIKGEIPYEGVDHATQNKAMAFMVDGKAPAPCQLLVCQGNGDAKQLMMQAAAEQTAMLLQGANKGKVMIGKFDNPQNPDSATGDQTQHNDNPASATGDQTQHNDNPASSNDDPAQHNINPDTSTDDPALSNNNPALDSPAIRQESADSSASQVKPLEAGGIAFLVRSARDARLAREALKQRGIQSVYLTNESVLDQDVARDLSLILKAVMEPTNDRALRAALGTQLMLCQAEEIEQVKQDMTAEQLLLEEFQEYHDIWQSKNVGAMLMALLRRRQLPEKWLAQDDGERLLTNLRHLMELLQARAAVAPGMHRLLKWLNQEIADDQGDSLASDELQLRLESEENLVKIVTMHTAKGLEYDVVMIPDPLFAPSNPSKNQPAFYHQQQGGDHQDLDTEIDSEFNDDSNAKGDHQHEPSTEIDNEVSDGSKAKGGKHYELCAEVGNSEKNRNQAMHELETEDMRLIYVALTRARYQCYLCLPDELGSRQNKSIMARLLGLVSPEVHEPQDENPAVFARLQAMLPPDLFGVQQLMPALTKIKPNADNISITKPPAVPDINNNWHLHSYSGLARRLNPLPHATGNTTRSSDGESVARLADASEQTQAMNELSSDTHLESTTGYTDDDTSTNPHESGGDISRFTLPRGARIGVALHSLLEYADFTNTSEHGRLCEQFLTRIGLNDPAMNDEWQACLLAWIQDILATPIDNNRLKLGALGRADRIDEMEFHFPVNCADDTVGYLAQHGYLRQTGSDRLGQVEGVMTGLIDLVFQADGRYFVLDYKSNHLGDTLADYAGTALNQAVTEHLYDLQYLIYAVALHRYLAASLPGYNYETHFGGVYYLFLRGMNGRDNATGVYFDRPDQAIVEGLDQRLGRQLTA